MVVGNYGYSWSAAFNDTCAMSLAFHTTVLKLSSANPRACGFQLRCLSE
ncbi:hypothetical protein [uncultured Rikenella sp.]|nr:hypothetical protein [uncultured Rikenella sp.]